MTLTLTLRLGEQTYPVRRIGDLSPQELDELGAIGRRLSRRRERPKRIREAGLAMLQLLAPDVPADRLDDDGLAEALNLVHLVARVDRERRAAA